MCCPASWLNLSMGDSLRASLACMRRSGGVCECLDLSARAVAQVYKEGGLTGEKMREAAISWKEVFDEIPINAHSSPLAASLLHSIEPGAVADSRDFARLDLSVGPLLEKNLEFLNDCLDDVVAEQQKVGWGVRLKPCPGACIMQLLCILEASNCLLWLAAQAIGTWRVWG